MWFLTYHVCLFSLSMYVTISLPFNIVTISLYVSISPCMYILSSLSMYMPLSLSLSPTHPIYTHLGILPLGFPTCLLFTYTRPTTISPSSLALTIYISLCTYLSRTYRVSLEPTHPYTHKCKQCLYPPCLPPSVCVWHKNFTHVPPLLLLAAVCSLHKGLANFICLSSSPRLAFCHILREIDAICRKKFHLKQLVISTL